MKKCFKHSPKETARHITNAFDQWGQSNNKIEGKETLGFNQALLFMSLLSSASL